MTTPRWLQVPSLAALLLLTAYFVACFTYALGPGMPTWTVFGNWQMFTTIDRAHHAVEGEAFVDGAWTPLDLDALFPSQWDGGPRYANAFRKSPQRLRVLADSACGRDPRHPERVRFYDLRWPAVPGQAPEPRRKLTRTEMIDWTCGRTVQRPKGARL